MNYSPEYFVNKYSRIPETLWCSGSFIDSGERRCALGWLGVGVNPSFSEYKEELHAIDAIFKLIDANIEFVNDGKDERFQEHTPKARVLAALEYVKTNIYSVKHLIMASK